MEHARKMVIVPQELIEKIEERPAQKTNTLDTEMHRILMDKKLDDSTKWKLYNQVLQKFLHYAENTRKPIKLPILDTEMSTDEQRSSNALLDELVETFPKFYKPDARSLLKTMIRSNIIAWDSDGTIYVHNKPINGSNIVDVMHSIIRVRKTSTRPTGWQEVMTALKELNVPSKFIGSHDALRFLGRQDLITPIMTPSSPSTPLRERLRTRATPTLTSLDRWEPYTP